MNELEREKYVGSQGHIILLSYYFTTWDTQEQQYCMTPKQKSNIVNEIQFYYFVVIFHIDNM